MDKKKPYNLFYTDDHASFCEQHYPHDYDLQGLCKLWGRSYIGLVRVMAKWRAAGFKIPAKGSNVKYPDGTFVIRGGKRYALVNNKLIVARKYEYFLEHGRYPPTRRELQKSKPIIVKKKKDKPIKDPKYKIGDVMVRTAAEGRVYIPTDERSKILNVNPSYSLIAGIIQPERKLVKRNSDLSQKIPVIIDRKTTIYVPLGTDPDEAREKFYNRNLKPNQ